MASEAEPEYFLVPEMSAVQKAILETQEAIFGLPRTKERDEFAAVIERLTSIIKNAENRVHEEQQNDGSRYDTSTLDLRLHSCQSLRKRAINLLSILVQLRKRARILRYGKWHLSMGAILVSGPGPSRRNGHEGALVEMTKYLDAAVSDFECRESISVLNLIDEFFDAERRGAEWGVAEESAQFLEEVVRVSAGYSSVVDCKPPPPTNVPEKLAGELQRWPTGHKQVYFLSGEAEAGKSFVSLDICVRIHSAAHSELLPILGASFFFSQDHTSSRLFLPTIVYQVQRALRADIDTIGTMRQHLQHGDDDGMQEDVRRLLHKALANASSHPAALVLVIDGVDKCKERALVPSLLRHLLSLCFEFPWLYIFITSRPHPYVMAVLVDPAVASIVDHRQLPDSAQVWTQTAQRYLEHRVPQIPSYSEYLERRPNALGGLVRRARGNLIFARVAVDFLDIVHDNPDYHFAFLLSPSALTLAPLTTFYRRLLDREIAHRRERDGDASTEFEEYKCLLSTVLFFVSRGNGLPLDPAFLLRHHLALDDVLSITDHLRCVLTVSSDARVVALHDSFREFLMDEKRYSLASHIDPAYACFAAFESAYPVTTLLLPCLPLGPPPPGCRSLKHPLLALWPYYLLQTRPDDLHFIVKHLAPFVPSVPLAMYAWVTTRAQAMRAGRILLCYFKSSMSLLPFELSICAEYFKFVSYVQLWRDQQHPSRRPFPDFSHEAVLVQALTQEEQTGLHRYPQYDIVLERNRHVYVTAIGTEDVRVDLTIDEDDMARYRTVMKAFIEELHSGTSAVEGNSPAGVLEGTYKIDDWGATDAQSLILRGRGGRSRHAHCLVAL